jgi:hypothetical protein
MKKLSLIISIALLALVGALSLPQITHAAGCTINSLSFPGIPSAPDVASFTYNEAAGATVVAQVQTSDCVGQNIFLSIMQEKLGFDVAIENFDERSFQVPPSGNFIVTMKASEEECSAATGFDCVYYIDAGTTEEEKHAVSSLGKPSGNLNYDCDGGCDDTPWLLIYDTSGASDTTVNQACIPTKATFSHYTDPGQLAQDGEFYLDNNKPQVNLIITTNDGCIDKPVKVTLASTYVPGGATITDKEPDMYERSFIVPATKKFEIGMKTGDKLGCLSRGNAADCAFFLKVTSTDGHEYNSRNKNRGNIDYECDGFCDSVAWKYLGDTSANPGDHSIPNEVAIQSGGATLQNTGACAGQENCYEVSPGLGSVLTKFFGKFSVITESTSLGGFLNALIKIVIGIFGLASVVMIMYEGAKLFYAKKDDKPYDMNLAKNRILAVLGGFLLSLLMYPLLRTINPDLLNLTPQIDAATLDVFSRVGNPNFDNLKNIDVSTTEITPGDYSDTTLLVYLSHQQGWAGAASIIWAANRGYSSVPQQTPWVSKNGGIINSNMQKNYYGQGTATPKNFLEDWRKRVEKKKTSTVVIPSANKTALETVASETASDLAMLTAVCRIESYECSKANAVNGKYSGLFQMGPSEFAQYGKKPAGNIFDPYFNTYAGAMYAKSNLAQINKNWSKISN